jgi:protein-L-isoaspartate(D-aspartate) O-methyltransferase
MIDFALARRLMIDGQVRTFDVNSLPLLAALAEVPRERFVPEDQRNLAYADRNLAVARLADGSQRQMLSPMVMARLIQGLEVQPGERVLDVAGGLGYSAAVLTRLGAEVTLLEADEGIAGEARRTLGSAGYAAVTVESGPLDGGCPDRVPFDAILINGCIERRPTTLLEQLADGGRLGCIEGRGRAARATIYVRAGEAFGARSPFDAAAPLLPAFREEPGFVF